MGRERERERNSAELPHSKGDFKRCSHGPNPGSNAALRPPPRNATRSYFWRKGGRGDPQECRSTVHSRPEETIIPSSDVPHAAWSRGSGPSATCQRDRVRPQVFRTMNGSFPFSLFLPKPSSRDRHVLYVGTTFTRRTKDP